MKRLRKKRRAFKSALASKKSYGFLYNPIISNERYLEGLFSGDLMILYLDHSDSRGFNMWMCECGCGELVLVDERILLGKRPPKSCGCK